MDGLCRLRLFNNKENKIVALITEIEENTSATITNSIDTIIESLIKDCFVPSDTIFIEHYENNSMFREAFELVTFDNNNLLQWESLNRSKVSQLLDCNIEELDNSTISIARLVNDIEKLRTEINPLLDLPYSEDKEQLKRFVEIEENKISKQSVEELISLGCNEERIQKLLKKDLSIFAEVYAKPEKDYICFSEFPIDSGFVDFVVFSGISRMDVFLIEVKGAEFNLFNQGHYDKFSSKIEIAMHQIRERISYISRNNKEFRNEIHSIREKVEKGSAIHNSFIGPSDHLEVDSEKDINLYAVVIGGRTVDDITESRKRHDLELSSAIKIKVDSWDTWIRKLKRK